MHMSGAWRATSAYIALAHRTSAARDGRVPTLWPHRRTAFPCLRRLRDSFRRDMPPSDPAQREDRRERGPGRGPGPEAPGHARCALSRPGSRGGTPSACSPLSPNLVAAPAGTLAERRTHRRHTNACAHRAAGRKPGGLTPTKLTPVPVAVNHVSASAGSGSEFANNGRGGPRRRNDGSRRPCVEGRETPVDERDTSSALREPARISAPYLLAVRSSSQCTRDPRRREKARGVQRYTDPPDSTPD